MGDVSDKSVDAAIGGRSAAGGRDDFSRFPQFAAPNLSALVTDQEATDVDQLANLQVLYDQHIGKSWRAYVRQVEEVLRPLPSERASHVARSNTAVHDARETLKRAVVDSNDAIRSAWQQAGSALGVKIPALPDPVTFADQPPMERSKGDINYRSYLRKAGRVSSSFGWVWPALFVFPLLIAGVLWFVANPIAATAGAAWAVVGVILLRLHARAQARSIFLQLANSVGRYHAAQLRDFAQAKLSAETSLEEYLTRLDNRLTAYSDQWRKSLSDCNEVVGTIGLELDRLLAGNPAALARFTQSVPVTIKRPPQPIALRIGEVAAEPPVSLSLENAGLLTGVQMGPQRLGRNFPYVWTPGRARALLLSDQAAASAGASNMAGAVLSRILLQAAPGKAQFIFFDPVGLGNSIAAFLKLGDEAREIITGQAWSNREHIRSRIRDLLAHIETVTQKYLRNDYTNIEAYNAENEAIPEAYRFLFIFDYPDQFDDEMSRDLGRIIQNGPRCGVFTFLHHNAAAQARHGVKLDGLSPFVVELDRKSSTPGWTIVAGAEGAAGPLIPDQMPEAELVNEIIKRFAKAAAAGGEVKVSYESLLARAGVDAEPLWQRSSVEGFSAPLGPLGAKDVQTFHLGKGMAHHALIVGRPGSGKSNLMHVLITSLARLYPPDEIQFFLIDFKKGVEFKAYADARLPHARVIAIESEREFGMSVLADLDRELANRGKTFSAAGAVNIAEFRGKTGTKLPRIVLVVDEFQEFFSVDDRLGEQAKTLFDRLVRQGRAFGIHLVLGTQSLANAGLPLPTRDQMNVRIAMQCSEADSRQILSDNNSAARLLSRPGEAIYNDSAGQVEANSLFQVAMFSENDRHEQLQAILQTTQASNWRGPPPVVFAGHEPADITSSPSFRETPPVLQRNRLDLWIGEPISLQPTTFARISRQAGRNLACIDKDEERAVGVLTACLCSVAAQSSPDNLRIFIQSHPSADSTWDGHPADLAESLPHPVEVGSRRELEGMLKTIHAELTKRTNAGGQAGETIILALYGLHRIRDLRPPEGGGGGGMRLGVSAESSLRDLLIQILKNGPEVGIHTLLWCDSLPNLTRALGDREGVPEIGLRLSGPMPPNDSHKFFGEAVASQISKPHRMVKFDEDQVGVFEQFRPFSIPSREFLIHFGRTLRSRATVAAGG